MRRLPASSASSFTPLERALQTQLRLLQTTLKASTITGYRYAIRDFVAFLRESFPDVTHPRHLQRDPHLLQWLEALWTYRTRKGQPRKASARIQRVLCLRTLLNMIWDSQPQSIPNELLRSSDVPKRDFPLPRPLSAEDDSRLRQHWESSTGLLDSALLLMRLTGIRIGECVDLAPDCLRHLGDQRWSIHVPHGKPRSERWVPVDDTARALLERLAFLRSLPLSSAGDFLLARPRGRTQLMLDLRQALNKAVSQAGLQGHFVPHQLRHTYATSLLRAGVSLPALMRLLGHHNANMTLIYVEITQLDLHREYQAALQNPRYQIPVPASLFTALSYCGSISDTLLAAINLLDPYCDGQHARLALLMSRRLARIRALLKKTLESN